jgi:dCMP deaminase
MTGRSPAKWDPRFMAVAQEVRSWSSDPRKRVGALLVSPDGRRVAWGYNGHPRDFEEMTAGRILDRETKNRYSLHAEDNAIAQAATDVTGWTMYVTEAPCLRCAMVIHRAGISRVVTGLLDEQSAWHLEQVEAEGFLAQMGVQQSRMEVPTDE